jgi:hypothetical protein
MIIGKATWDHCDKCVFFDLEYGCDKLEELEVEVRRDEGIVCLTGMEVSEPDFTEFETWE